MLVLRNWAKLLFCHLERAQANVGKPTTTPTSHLQEAAAGAVAAQEYWQGQQQELLQTPCQAAIIYGELAHAQVEAQGGSTSCVYLFQIAGHATLW